ncbi:MAG: hypothetical protein OEW21_19660 [Betaproteobacteria bacterium]|nr:hypothetical protein [Betaproteobacteria bacterium]
MNTLRILVIATQCVLFSGCVGISGGPVSGKVLEEDSGKPIAGAIVVVRWFGVVGGMGHGGKVCYHVAATLSRNDGSYLVPEWYERENRYGWGMGHREYYVIAYKAGYGWPRQPSQDQEISLLTPFKGTVEERFKYFDSVISNTICSHHAEIGKHLYWPWMALYEEARSISVTVEHRKWTDRLRSDAQSRLVDQSKPTTVDEYGRIVNVDVLDSFKVEPLR